MSIHEKALDGMFDDMDDMETKKMFPGDKPMTTNQGGMGVTITITPNAEGEEEFPDENHDIALCKGGCAYHKGGIVEGETDDISLPPFLRKKK